MPKQTLGADKRRVQELYAKTFQTLVHRDGERVGLRARSGRARHGKAGKFRDWCSSVLQSHAWHPSLIYFRSVGAGAGWPATLGAMMDLALIFELLADEPAIRESAVLLRQEGLRLLHEINGLIGLEPREDATSTSEVMKLCGRLTAAGYKLGSPLDTAEFASRRREHAA